MTYTNLLTKKNNSSKSNSNKIVIRSAVGLGSMNWESPSFREGAVINKWVVMDNW